MNREKAIQEACAIIGLAYYSIGDYGHASDCFCTVRSEPGEQYANEGQAIAYVRLAVLNALRRDGFTIHPSFNPETGLPLVK